MFVNDHRRKAKQKEQKAAGLLVDSRRKFEAQLEEMKAKRLELEKKYREILISSPAPFIHASKGQILRGKGEQELPTEKV